MAAPASSLPPALAQLAADTQPAHDTSEQALDRAARVIDAQTRAHLQYQYGGDFVNHYMPAFIRRFEYNYPALAAKYDADVDPVSRRSKLDLLASIHAGDLRGLRSAWIQPELASHRTALEDAVYERVVVPYMQGLSLPFFEFVLKRMETSDVQILAQFASDFVYINGTTRDNRSLKERVNQELARRRDATHFQLSRVGDHIATQPRLGGPDVAHLINNFLTGERTTAFHPLPPQRSATAAATRAPFEGLTVAQTLRRLADAADRNDLGSVASRTNLPSLFDQLATAAAQHSSGGAARMQQ